ncbi:MAG TPA: glycoside hydrolase family 3 N-terminal domain-containing protein, partial [Balneolales bacterium]|nr:glycoside hydrolase family 3 N-terminal domain-containing protein [Balneolales bacterium]
MKQKRSKTAAGKKMIFKSKFYIPIILLLIIVLSIFTNLPSFADLFTGSSFTSNRKDADSVQVQKILDNMSLRQKVGQLFITYARGHFRNEDTPEFKRIKRLITKEDIGGIIFFDGNIYGQAMLTNKLQKLSHIPLWITEDMEFGPAMRIHGSTRFPPAMAIAATGNPNYAYQVGRITGYEANALGVNQIFAPDVDVNNNPDNPVINVRSFSSEAKTVGIFADAFMKGVMDEGVVPTAKHFPGHGDTHVDSHVGLPVSPYSYSRLDTLELVPFKKVIDSGIPSIMTAHIAFPKISGNDTLPATLDPDIIHNLLRDSLHFKGLVVTDALRMEGITLHYSPGQAAVKAIQAGSDLLLLPSDQYTAIEAVMRAVKSGKISEQRLNRSVRKILDWKVRKGLFRNDQINVNDLDQKIRTEDHVLLSQKIARKSVTVLKNKDHILPIVPHRYPKILLISMADNKDGNTGLEMARMMREYHPDVAFHIYDERTCRSDLNRIIHEARHYSLIVVGSFVHIKTGSDIQLNREQIHFLKRLRAQHRPLVLVSFGNPYIIRDLPRANVQVCAWSAANNQVDQTVPALFGASEINGRLPISIPPYYKRGDGIHIPKTILRIDKPEVAGLSSDSLYNVQRIMRNAIQDSVFPGGVVAVVKDGIMAYNKGFGYQTYKKIKPIRNTDMYDMASLTKVVATTSSIMKLYDEGKINLNDHLSKYFKAFRKPPKNKVTIKELLTHTSGFPPDFPMNYVHKYKGHKALTKAALEVPLINPPGKKYVYSDINFITLGA